MVYATLGASAGVIALLAAALSLLYWRCRRPDTARAAPLRKHYSAVSTGEAEAEVTSSVSSQPSPTASNDWSQTAKRSGSDVVVVPNDRGE